jgi:dUTP pyrophosphatase
MLKVPARVLPHGEGLPLPARATPGAAGLDLRAAISDPMQIGPGARALVPTGLVLAIPAGWEGQVRPRSGMAFRHGITLVNTPGTIDSDYRGELMVPLINLSQEPFLLQRGERIAQVVFSPVAMAEIDLGSELDATERDAGGFGSTGR